MEEATVEDEVDTEEGEATVEAKDMAKAKVRGKIRSSQLPIKTSTAQGGQMTESTTTCKR